MFKKRFISTLVITMVTALLFTTAAFANPTATAKYGTPTIDGVMEDLWKDCDVMSTDTLVEGQDSGSVAKVRALWDEKHLYFFAEVTDAVLNKGDIGNEYWHCDAVEFFVDEGNEKTASYDEKDAQIRVDIENFLSGNGLATADNVVSAVKKTDKGYNIELSYKLVGGAKADQQIGVDFQLNEDVGEGRRTVIKCWSATSPNGFWDTSIFGTITLKAASKPAQTTNPVTGEAGIIPYLAVAGVSAATYFAAKKRQK